MNLKKSFMGAVAGLALVGSIAAPIASAQPAESDYSNNSTTAYVNVHTGGAFDVYFSSSNLNFGDVVFDAQHNQAVTRDGAVVIAYVDTLVNRPSFNVQMQASDFVAGGPYFSSSNLKVTRVYNVQQGQWGGTPGGPDDIGDIGAFVNNGYVGQGGPWPKAWTAANELNVAKTVQFGYSGIGTVWANGQVDVSLSIPPTATAGNYTSTVTLTVIAGTQP